MDKGGTKFLHSNRQSSRSRIWDALVLTIIQELADILNYEMNEEIKAAVKLPYLIWSDFT